MAESRTPDADVIVIGAGAAGMVAAREVERDGHSTIILEASGRVGGRLYPRPYKGTDIELEFGGNAYSREFQPLLVAEYERYDLKEVGTAESGVFLQRLGGKVYESAAPVPEEEFADLERGLVHWADGVRRVSFDRPFDEQDLTDLDVSVADYFAPLNLPEATKDHLFSWTVHCNGEDPDRVSALHMMRWFAGFDNSAWNYYAKADRKWPTSREYLEKLSGDIKGEIRFNTPVTAVDVDGFTVVVTTRDGSQLVGRTVIVATPINSWKSLTFTPALSKGKQEAANNGQIGNNKLFIHARNAAAGSFATHWQAGIGVVTVNNALPDGSYILYAFVNNRRLDSKNPKAVEEALRTIMPEVEVLSVDEEDWKENDYRGGGFTAYAPGQLTSYDSALRSSEGRVHFATSDISQKWAGWIEGALGTGRDAAQSALSLLRS